MNTKYLFQKLSLLFSSFIFIRKNIYVILSLGLVASFGRVIQLGGFGEIDNATHVSLEIIIETSRVLIFLFVLGIANVKKGALQFLKLFSRNLFNKSQWTKIWKNLKLNWGSFIISFIGFSIISFTFNFLINQLAYETCLLISLKDDGILVPSASEWTILLFFKNILTIPFTIIFETILILWIIGKPLPGQMKQIVA